MPQDAADNNSSPLQGAGANAGSERSSAGDESCWDDSQYALVDFGNGRKLERFGSLLLDRSSPAAESSRKANPAAWSDAAARLDARGEFASGDRARMADGWACRIGPLSFWLKLTPFGHVGLFPEQRENWRLQHERAARAVLAGQRFSALNLFAYTGATTLAVAHAGGAVVHVDASAPAVRWARENAQHSSLTDAPVRWIVEDARKFVQRELRRGSQYDWIVLDPPSYGHGPKGSVWDITRDLPELLDNCLQLLRPGPGAGLLLTAHSVDPGPDVVNEMLHAAAPGSLQVSNKRLKLYDVSGRGLDAGFAVHAETIA